MMGKIKNPFEKYIESSIFDPAVIGKIHNGLGNNLFLTRLVFDLSASLKCDCWFIYAKIGKIIKEIAEDI
jgi:hypothetical protein